MTEPGAWRILLVHIRCTAILKITAHHIPEIIIQELVPVGPLVRRLGHTVNARTPPGIGAWTLCNQRGKHFSSLLLQGSDVVET